MAIKKGLSYHDRPPHEVTEASKVFKRELDAELAALEDGTKVEGKKQLLEHDRDFWKNFADVVRERPNPSGFGMKLSPEEIGAVLEEDIP